MDTKAICGFVVLVLLIITVGVSGSFPDTYIWSYDIQKEAVSISMGDITSDDGNEIVVTAYRHSKIFLLNSSGQHLCNFSTIVDGGSEMDYSTGVHIGDVDGDGQNEIGVSSDSYTAFILNSTCGQVWNYTYANQYLSEIWIANLTNDEGNEVVITTIPSGGSTTHVVLLNSTGSVLWNKNNFFTGVDYGIYGLGVGDVDGDGQNEIAIAGDRWDNSQCAILYSNGSTMWTYGTTTNDGYGYGVDIGNVTSDNGNEVLFCGGDGYAHLLNSTGSLIWKHHIVSGSSKPFGHCKISDVNGDGQNEVVISSIPYNRLFVLNQSGTHIGSYSVEDMARGLWVGDVDGGGNNEILYGTDDTLYLSNWTYIQKWLPSTYGLHSETTMDGDYSLSIKNRQSSQNYMNVSCYVDGFTILSVQDTITQEYYINIPLTTKVDFGQFSGHETKNITIRNGTSYNTSIPRLSNVSNPLVHITHATYNSTSAITTINASCDDCTYNLTIQNIPFSTPYVKRDEKYMTLNSNFTLSGTTLKIYGVSSSENQYEIGNKSLGTLTLSTPAHGETLTNTSAIFTYTVTGADTSFLCNLTIGDNYKTSNNIVSANNTPTTHTLTLDESTRTYNITCWGNITTTINSSTRTFTIHTTSPGPPHGNCPGINGHLRWNPHLNNGAGGCCNENEIYNEAYATPEFNWGCLLISTTTTTTPHIIPPADKFPLPLIILFIILGGILIKILIF